MTPIRVTLPDNSVKELPRSMSVLEVAGLIGPRLAKATVAGVVDGVLVDLRTVIERDCKLSIVTLDKPQAIEVIRHSAAHIMAQAVQDIWPEVKVTIGPVTETGFFYDLDSPRAFSPEDLEKVERGMQKIVDADIEIVREVWPVEKAISTFKSMGENFKVEIIEDLVRKEGVKEVSIYHQGKWFDLCRGPHVPRTSFLRAFKLLSIAGAYWRGDEKNKMLQRIYGTAFGDKKDLEAYLTQLEEAKKRDHRKLGKDLDLFMFHDWAPASPFFLPKGATIYNELLKFMRELYFENGYQEVVTPQVFDIRTFITSGHYENYMDNMYMGVPAPEVNATVADWGHGTEFRFQEIRDQAGKLNLVQTKKRTETEPNTLATQVESSCALKAMNCPGHALMYKSGRHSYRDLPWRVADFGRLHRYERGGVVHGLARVRTFSQDDAHIFCTMDQVESEITKFMNLLNQVYKTFGFENYNVFLSTRPEKRLGSDEIWDRAEGALKNAFEHLKLPYTINAGDGAFYGPKLDIMVTDAIGRAWQLGTVQMDMNMANRFELDYIAEDNKPHKPVVLHRAILGSLERFLAVFIEHCSGAFPTWIAPQQVSLISITNNQDDFLKEVHQKLRARGVRAELDLRYEKLGMKIREAQLAKVPYMIVAGDKEVESRTLSVRLRNGKEIKGVAVDEFIDAVSAEIATRKLTSAYV